MKFSPWAKVTITDNDALMVTDPILNIRPTLSNIEKIHDFEVGLLPKSWALTREWYNRSWTKSLDWLHYARFKTTEKNIGGSQKPVFKGGDPGLLTSIFQRKTVRSFKNQHAIRLNAFIEVLKSSYEGFPFQTSDAIKTEALRSIVVVYNVEGLEPGIYEFLPDQKDLNLILPGSFARDVSSLIAGMETAQSAHFTLFLAVNFDLMMSELGLGELSLRKIYSFVGQCSQRFLVRCSKYNIFGVPTPAISDKKAYHFLKLDGENVLPVYSMTMGLE